MKKIFNSMVMVALVAILSVTFPSCEETSGDFLYDVTTSADTSTGSYMSYKASGAEATIIAEVAKVGTQTSQEDTYFILNGKEDKCDKAIKAAVDKGMNTVEASDSYNKLFDLSETTVVITKKGEVIYSRKFKK